MTEATIVKQKCQLWVLIEHVDSMRYLRAEEKNHQITLAEA